jgi:hypothetical protein
LCYQNFGKISQKIAKLVEFKTGKRISNIFSFSLLKNRKKILGKNKRMWSKRPLFWEFFSLKDAKMRLCFYF